MSARSLAELGTRHLEEWAAFRAVFPLVELDSEGLKTARAAADVLKIRQEAERRAMQDSAGLESGPVMISWEGQ